MSFSERQENTAYAAFLEARETSGSEWPEPATSSFYKVVRRACILITSQRAAQLHAKYNSDVIQVYGVEELATELAENIILNLHRFNGRSRFSTWLFRLASNGVNMVARKMGSQQRIHKPVENLPGLVYKSSPGGVTEEYRQLDADEKHVYDMRVVDEMSLSECAEELGCSKTEMWRKWQKLKTKLKSLPTS